MRALLLSLVWLALAPFGGAGEPPAHAWQPPLARPANAPPELDTAHRLGERLHERWLPDVSRSLQHSRRLAVRMLCDLGPIGLALVDCPLFTAAPVPEPPRARPRPGSSSSVPALDFGDIRRRSIEERMHSI